MSTLRPFRFGVIAYHATSKEEWVARARRICQVSGERFNALELNIIIYAVVVTENRSQAAQQLAGRFKATEEQMFTTPHCLIGTPDQMSEDLLERRERYGISYISVFEDNVEAFAPVVARLVGK